MKYVDTAIVFDEIPDEITLAINISGCRIHCPDCHSKYLWEDIGEELDFNEVQRLVSDNPGITCVCFMGGDKNTISDLCHLTKCRYPELRTAWYTGQDYVKTETLKYLNYVKIGPYKKEFGPLNDPRTNQRLFKVIHTPVPSIVLEDITYKFWKQYENSSM